MLALEAVEQRAVAGRVVPGPIWVEQRGRTPVAKALGKRGAERRAREAIPDRGHRDRHRSRCVEALEPAARLQLLAQRPQQLGREGARVDQLAEALGRELEQLAVAAGADRGRARLARQQRELADGGPAIEHADHGRLGPLDHRLEPAGEHHVHCARLLAGAKQPLPGRDPRPSGTGAKRLAQLLRKPGEDPHPGERIVHSAEATSIAARDSRLDRRAAGAPEPRQARNASVP